MQMSIANQKLEQCWPRTDVNPRAKYEQCKTQKKISQDYVNGEFKGKACHLDGVQLCNW